MPNTQIRCPRCGGTEFWIYGKDRKCRNRHCGHEFNLDDNLKASCNLTPFSWNAFLNCDVLQTDTDVTITFWSGSDFTLKSLTDPNLSVSSVWNGMEYGAILENYLLKAGKWVIETSNNIVLVRLENSDALVVMIFNANNNEI